MCGMRHVNVTRTSKTRLASFIITKQSGKDIRNNCATKNGSTAVMPHTLTKVALILLLLAITRNVVAAEALGSCSPEAGCYPPPVPLASMSYPLRTISVSSTCGDGSQPTLYCRPSLVDECDTDASKANCTVGQHPKEHMLDRLEGDTENNPDLTTYWQSENTVTRPYDSPTAQYIEVNICKLND